MVFYSDKSAFIDEKRYDWAEKFYKYEEINNTIHEILGEVDVARRNYNLVDFFLRE